MIPAAIATLRDSAFDSSERAKEGIKEKNDGWVHVMLGRHDSLSDMVQHFYAMTQSKAADTQEKEMLGTDA